MDYRSWYATCSTVPTVAQRRRKLGHRNKQVRIVHYLKIKWFLQFRSGFLDKLPAFYFIESCKILKKNCFFFFQILLTCV